MTKKFQWLLPKGARIINYAVKATGRSCDVCEHVPEKRPPKPGYPEVSEEMRLMRVKLPDDSDVSLIDRGRRDFTVTGNLIELNTCADTASCRERARQLRDTDGNPVFDPALLDRFR